MTIDLQTLEHHYDRVEKLEAALHHAQEMVDLTTWWEGDGKAELKTEAELQAMIDEEQVAIKEFAVR